MKPQTCARCGAGIDQPATGHPRDESMQDRADWDYTAHLRKCHACAEAERAVDEYRRGRGADTRGLHVYTTRG